MKKRLTWKNNYGDGSCTDDLVLWVDGKPTDTIISPCSGFNTIYIEGEEFQICDTKKEGKEIAMEEIAERGLYMPDNLENLGFAIEQRWEFGFLEEHYEEFSKEELKALVHALLVYVEGESREEKMRNQHLAIKLAYGNLLGL